MYAKIKTRWPVSHKLSKCPYDKQLLLSTSLYIIIDGAEAMQYFNVQQNIQLLLNGGTVYVIIL